MIAAVLSLSRQLHLKTVAEGVEEKNQFDFLRENGCDIVQGYYFSPPVSESEYNGLLDGE